MLQAIRDRATGWIAWAIVTLIAIPFALWGVYDYMSPTQTVAVATVNGNELGLRRFQQLYQQERAQIRAFLGDNYRPDLIDEAELRTYTVDQLVENEVMVQAGLEDGMRIGDEQLAAAIQSIPAFQYDGGFSQDAYDIFLRNRGYSPLGFEFDMRRTLVIEQIAIAVRSGSIASRHEVEALSRLREQTRRYLVLRLEAAKYRPAEISDSEIAAYYDAHRGQFVTPERVKLEYIELSRDALAETINVDEAELMSLYDDRKENYVEPDQREASHILISVTSDADDEAIAAARARLGVIRDELTSGASFEELAREHSEDPGSAPQGGALGWFARGIMDPAFEEAAFALERGAVSEVVQSTFGFHLIKVTGARNGEIRSFDRVRSELLREYRSEQAEQLFVDRVNTLQNLTFEHPDTLAVAAEELDEQILESGLVSRAGADATGSAAEPRFLEAAFSTEVMEARNNSELLEFDGGRVVVLRVKDHQPSSPEPLEAVRDRVANLIASEYAAEAAGDAGMELVRRLRAGESMEHTAAEHEAEWSQERSAGRQSLELDGELAAVLFRMPRPAAESVVFDGTMVAGGDFVVIGLRAVEEGVEDGSGAQTADRLATELGLADLDALVAALRTQAEVAIHQQNLR